MTHSWNNIPGKFEIEVAKDETGVVRLSNDAIIPIESLGDYLQVDDLYYLIIHWRSRGSHTLGRIYGGPDDEGWPPFHEDHRTPQYAELRLAGAVAKLIKLPPIMTQNLFDYFVDQINEQSLPPLD